MKTKKTTYVYQLIYKFKKHPELLLEHGFQFYSDEDNEVKIFAHPVTLKEDNPLFVQCVRFLEHCYEEATTKEREEDFSGFEFKEELQPDQKTKYSLVMTDELRKEFEAAQLCVSIDKNNEDAAILFVNSPMQDAHYNFQTLYNCDPEFIEKLLKDRVIFKRRYRY